MSYRLIHATNDELASGAAQAGYRHYIESHREKLPPAACEFALADWHYDYHDHKSPHDGWMTGLRYELNVGDHLASLEISLLCAYHDIVLTLNYSGVSLFECSQNNRPGRDSWHIDEFQLGEGCVTHTIRSEKDIIWRIEFTDFDFAFSTLVENP